MSVKISRRNALKLTGATLGSLALGPRAAEATWSELTPPPGLTQLNTQFKSLKPFYPGEPLASDEMRITFMGTSVVQRRAQHTNSVYVELGNGDCFIFDCGSGVTINYNAMQIKPSKMDKIFLTHLHGDHMSDLTHIYCFGPAADRKSPLYVWGPSASLVPEPGTDNIFEDGTIKFCQLFREMMRWHSESFSFLPTSYKGGQDGYDIIATELNWKPDMGGVQTWNSGTGATTSISPGNIAYQTDEVKISFFPAVHDRNGSISYKLEWINQGLSMIFSGDTKPNTSMIANATGGVDVLIHEMVVPPEIWANRNSGLMPDGSPEWTQAYNAAKAIQDNSHTPQMALGYILSQLEKPPRLAVATHFQASDDTIGPALDDIRFWYQGPVAIATDLMVINVSKKSIRQRRAVVSEYVWNTPVQVDSNNLNAAKYNGPYAQFDQSLLDTVIPPCDYDPASCSSAAAKRR